MGQDVIQRSFAGGELSPALHARADLAKYQTGLRLCRNFIVRRSGAVTKRPGTRYLGSVKTPANGAVLIPYVDEANDASYVLEFGDLYIRFWYHDALVKVAGNPYEVVTPYAIADVKTLYPRQFGNVITLTHPTYGPRELVRFAHTNWTLTAISFDPGIGIPTAGGRTPGSAPGTLTMHYVVTAVKIATGEESYPLATPIDFINVAKPTELLPNPMFWTAPAGGPVEYNVYCDPNGNGIFGFIGRSAYTSFRDTGIIPDFSSTPPQKPYHEPPADFIGALTPLFGAADYYPAVNGHHQARTYFARTNKERERVWGSQTGAPHNFSKSFPLQADDAVGFLIATDTISPVHHLVSLDDLVLLAEAGVWRIVGDVQLGGPITPTSITPRQASYYGAAAFPRPVVIGSTVVYVQARGSGLRELRFSDGGQRETDLALFASHLVDGYGPGNIRYSLTQLAFTLEPFATIWGLRSDGILLGCTYVPEQEIVAWHRHLTGASGRGEDVCVDWDLIESICSLPNNATGQDRLYMTVRRTVNGSSVCYVERFADVFWPEQTAFETAFFVDAGITYNGAPTATITGLDHLEGRIVAALGDGQVLYDGSPTGSQAAAFTVTGGSITLPQACSLVQVGLPIRFAEVETLPLDANGTAARAKLKTIKNATAIVYGSDDALDVGPDGDHLRTFRRGAWEQARSWRTGQLPVAIPARYTKDGTLRLRHRNPTPCTIVGIVPSVDLGG